jgi:hypothetical protein
MSLYRLDDAPELDRPILVAAFDGWVDAGAGGTAAAAQLIEGGRVIATFENDALFDYRSRRPTLDIIDGRPISLDWPELRLWLTETRGRSLLVLTGPEPDYRWRELAADVTELARQLSIASWVSLGAIPAAVPHTRPVPILATASLAGLLPEGIQQGPPGLLRVPSAVLSVIELAVSGSGVPAVGFFAQVPHYVSTGYPNAAIELLGTLGRYLEVELPIGQLASRALETRGMLDAAVTANERTRLYVEQLEKAADEARLPSGDELIADIERFLRDRGEESGGEGGEGETRLH